MFSGKFSKQRKSDKLSKHKSDEGTEEILEPFQEAIDEALNFDWNTESRGWV